MMYETSMAINIKVKDILFIIDMHSSNSIELISDFPLKTFTLFILYFILIMNFLKQGGNFFFDLRVSKQVNQLNDMKVKNKLIEK